jgi:hypothetical protein
MSKGGKYYERRKILKAVLYGSEETLKAGLLAKLSSNSFKRDNQSSI